MRKQFKSLIALGLGICLSVSSSMMAFAEMTFTPVKDLDVHTQGEDSLFHIDTYDPESDRFIGMGGYVNSNFDKVFDLTVDDEAVFMDGIAFVYENYAIDVNGNKLFDLDSTSREKGRFHTSSEGFVGYTIKNQSGQQKLSTPILTLYKADGTRKTITLDGYHQFRGYDSEGYGTLLVQSGTETLGEGRTGLLSEWTQYAYKPVASIDRDGNIVSYRKRVEKDNLKYGFTFTKKFDYKIQKSEVVVKDKSGKIVYQGLTGMGGKDPVFINENAFFVNEEYVHGLYPFYLVAADGTKHPEYMFYNVQGAINNKMVARQYAEPAALEELEKQCNDTTSKVKFAMHDTGLTPVRVFEFTGTLGDTVSVNNQTGWKQDNTGWWYVNSDGSCTKNGWQNIDGKDYYFDANGYMLHDTTTPDGYAVGADGAWIK